MFIRFRKRCRIWKVGFHSNGSGCSVVPRQIRSSFYSSFLAFFFFAIPRDLVSVVTKELTVFCKSPRTDLRVVTLVNSDKASVTSLSADVSAETGEVAKLSI